EQLKHGRGQCAGISRRRSHTALTLVSLQLTRYALASKYPATPTLFLAVQTPMRVAGPARSMSTACSYERVARSTSFAKCWTVVDALAVSAARTSCARIERAVGLESSSVDAGCKATQTGGPIATCASVAAAAGCRCQSRCNSRKP